MGNEAHCNVRFGKQQSEGKALLETSEIRFRGDFRLTIPFSTIKSAKAVDGELRLQTAEGLAVFCLGATAEKWCEKILHPKSRLEKLGVKPGARVSLLGDLDTGFLAEIGNLTKAVSKNKVAADSEWIFLAVDSKGDLGALSKISKSMEGAARLNSSFQGLLANRFSIHKWQCLSQQPSRASQVGRKRHRCIHTQPARFIRTCALEQLSPCVLEAITTCFVSFSPAATAPFD